MLNLRIFQDMNMFTIYHLPFFLEQKDVEGLLKPDELFMTAALVRVKLLSHLPEMPYEVLFCHAVEGLQVQAHDIQLVAI